MRSVIRGGLVLSLFALVVFVASGCSGGGTPTGTGGEQKDTKVAKGSQGQSGKNTKEENTAHEGWWCEEHGVPEEECIMCSTKLKAEAKAKGDWCKHDRAKSQCFQCMPEVKETYAAKYRAKYPGKEPPPATEND